MESENKKLYTITFEGIYSHGMKGIFSTLETSIKKSIEIIGEEPDDYHKFIIREYILDNFVEDGKLIVGVERFGTKIILNISKKESSHKKQISKLFNNYEIKISEYD